MLLCRGHTACDCLVQQGFELGVQGGICAKNGVVAQEVEGGAFQVGGEAARFLHQQGARCQVPGL